MSDLFEPIARDDNTTSNYFDEFGLDQETESERLARRLAEADLHLIDMLRRVREARNLSQNQLGELLGVSQATVSAFESCAAEPKMSTIRRYAHALNVMVVHHVQPTDTSLTGLFTLTVEATYVAHKPSSVNLSSYAVAANSKRTDFALGA